MRITCMAGVKNIGFLQRCSKFPPVFLSILWQAAFWQQDAHGPGTSGVPIYGPRVAIRAFGKAECVAPLSRSCNWN